MQKVGDLLFTDVLVLEIFMFVTQVHFALIIRDELQHKAFGIFLMLLR